ncbi:MAG TPA: hypothetical protein VMH04_22255 [Candidatus Solibacter sp.]|nr:hypothetical protein [Candidatus Solibacter sp.]
MNRPRISLWGAVLFAAAVFCVQTPSTAAQAAGGTIGHGTFPVKVTKTLDSSKLKDGDAIELETAGGFKLADGTLVPKGSKLAGHVVSAKARSKGDANSLLTLSFDKLNIQGGKQLSVKGTVQAIFPPADEPMGPNMATAGTSLGGSTSGGGPGGGLAGVSPAGIGITNSKSGSNAQASSSPQSVMDVKATGVQGMPDLQLEDGMVTSKGKNVKLGNGVRMIIQAEILG